jgi:hypothetical protein
VTRSSVPATAARTAALLVFLIGLPLTPPAVAGGPVFWVAPDGDDDQGDGSPSSPWATLTFAVDNVPDGATVMVRPGTYPGRVNLRRRFAGGITVRSEVPYQARLRHTSTVVTAFTAEGITLEGFDLAHSGPAAGGLVIQIQDLIAGPDRTRRITLQDNVIHDSFNNDLVKVNFGATQVTIRGNLFYNQAGSDEHIDVNSVTDVVIEGNVFFNDFEGSGRVNGDDTSSFIVIKDSDAGDDDMLGSRRITVRRNVFLHWQGSTGANFVLLGEDGQPFFEAQEVLVENNLFLGDSSSVMRAVFGVKGGNQITFRHNTVVGDLPSLAYAMRLNTEGQNPANQNLFFRANVWADPTGTLGAENPSRPNDFSDTPPGQTGSFVLARNLYWNGGAAIPEDGGELVNYTNDTERVVADPLLPPLAGLVLPRYLPVEQRFADGSTTIAQVFRRLAEDYGTPAPGSPLIGAADPAHAPADDLLGRARSDGAPDLGAVEAGAGEIFADGFESGGTGAWSGSSP